MKKCFVFLFAAVAGTNLMAATLHVDLNSTHPTAPYTTRETAATDIQTAVNAAVAGDTVQVWNGHYLLGSQISVSKAITVQSANGPETTIVDGQGSVRCFNLGESACTLSGLTITNGYTASNGHGGGIYCDDTTPVVTNCTITGNVALYGGGGMEGGTAYHCTITSNWTRSGGGMSRGTAHYCTISGNSAQNQGGGMSGGTAHHCTISGNSARYGGGMVGGTAYYCIFSGNTAREGGGMKGDTAYHCTFSGNAALQGGGMHSGTAYHCTFSGNSATEYGGGMVGYTANNCTISGNSATEYGGGIVGCTANNCIVWYNTAPSEKDLSYTTARYSCSPDVTHGVDGNITNAPSFVDAANGNYRLAAGSPCIDTGSNTYVVGSQDLDGLPRIDGGVVDMGAYEYQGVRLSITLPAGACEGDGLLSAAGSVSIPAPSFSNIVVNLVSSDVSEILVSNTVTILAGETNAVFDLDIQDDGRLDGSRAISVMASATNYVEAVASIRVDDNETTALMISMPSTVAENAESILGVVVSSSAPDEDVLVQLISDHAELIEGSVVTLSAGSTNAAFSLSVVDNGLIDGDHAVAISTQVIGWQNATSIVSVIDDEPRILSLDLPESFSEGFGILTNAGSVSVSGILVEDLIVELLSSDDDEMSVPSSVVISAGQSSVLFEVVAGDDDEFDGAALVAVTAQAAGYESANAEISMLDNEVHHLSIEGLSGEHFLLSPVSITVSARSIDEYPVAGYATEINLSASGDRGGVEIVPGTLTNMVDGVAAATVVFGNIGNDVALTVDGGGMSITSEVFQVVGPQIMISHEPLTNILVVAGESFSKSMIVSNAGNAVLEFSVPKLGQSLIAHYPFSGNATDESDNGHDGTVNGATLTQDRFGNADSAYLFDGVDDHIVVPDSTDLRLGGTDFTISSWVNETARNPSSVDAIIVKRGGGNSNGWFHSLLGADNVATAGKGGFQVSAGADPGAISSSVVPLNTWTHVVVTYDLSAQTLRFYVNGVLDSETPNIPSPNAATTAKMYIGRDSASVSYAFHGAIDDVRIYNRALSGLEIESLYNEVPSATWLSAVPGSGLVSAGSEQGVNVVFDAGDLVAGDYVSSDITLVCNDPVSPMNVLMASMLVLPPAPVIDVEPAAEYGTSNTVSWSMVPGSVQYEVEMMETTNSTALQQSGWISGTNHTFMGLSVGSTYCYRVRAGIIHDETVYTSAWSDWTWSTQIPVVDGDGDGIPDAWEDEYFGGVGSADATSDHDGDGQSDLAEFIAGMNPTNSVSLFELDGESDSTNDWFIVSWEAVTGRVYSVWWTAALTNHYSLLETDIHYPQSSYTDEVHQVEDQGFYRVEVDLE